MNAPQRGQWVALTYENGGSILVRFVAAARRRFDGGRSIWWEVDRGAYGVHRRDLFIPEEVITSWTLATRPPLLVSFVDVYGKRRFVGRYPTRAEAEAAISPQWRGIVTDIRIDGAR